MSQHDKRQTDLNIAFARSDWKDKDMGEPTPRTDEILAEQSLREKFEAFISAPTGYGRS